MSTSNERLKQRIDRLVAQHGQDDPYVKDLKRQLAASEATAGKTAQEVFRMQLAPVGKPKT